MNIKKLTVKDTDYPESLTQFFKPPSRLYVSGNKLSELLKRPRVAIVGSRKPTVYGRQVTSELAGKLAGQGIVIISGLAIGIDAIAHQAALEAGGLCIAVLPSPLDDIAPRANRHLAQRILDNGGALVSEYASGMFPQKQYFIARNRLVSGLADALLITEAAEKSGSLHTARFALEQGRDVMAVPGSITSASSVGTNNLLKAGHAAAITSYTDVLHVLGLHDHSTAAHAVRGRNAHEQTVLNLMLEGLSDGKELLEQSKLTTSEFNQVLTMLEISSKIRPFGVNHWSIR